MFIHIVSELLGIAINSLNMHGQIECIERYKKNCMFLHLYICLQRFTNVIKLGRKRKTANYRYLHIHVEHSY